LNGTFGNDGSTWLRPTAILKPPGSCAQCDG
jgi:hypothetical protein